MATYVVSSGVVSSGVTLTASQTMLVYSAGTALNTVVRGGNGWHNYTYAEIQNGGRAVGTVVESGHLDVLNGGSADSTTVNGGSASAFVNLGGHTDSTTVKNGGVLYVSAGGTATNVNIEANGTMLLNVNSNTYITGTSNGKSVKVGDGVTSNITLYASHWMAVASDWTASDTVIRGGNGWHNYTYVEVQNGGRAVGTVVESGHLDVLNGGSADSTTVNGASASAFVSLGGHTDSTTVKNGGVLYVSAGGTATNVNIESNGTMFLNVNSNTYITGTSNGKSVKVGDGVTSNITLYASHWMAVASDWTASDTVIRGGNGWHNYTYTEVQNGGRAVGTVVESGHLDVLNGGSADSTTVNGASASAFVSLGGHANSTTVKNGGVLYVSAGGSATSVNIESNGTMFLNVNSNTYITGTSNGKSVKVGDGVTSNITLYASHWMVVASDWTASDTVIRGGNGWHKYTYTEVQNGGRAVGTVVESGHLDVLNGGSADSTTISGASASAFVLGEANSTTVKTGGVLYAGGAETRNTIVDNNGVAYISAGGVESGAVVKKGGSLYIGKSGSAAASGSAVAATVQSGGSMTLFTSSYAARTTVLSGGSLFLNTGAVLEGTNTVAGRMVVSGAVQAEDARVDLDLTARNTDDAYLIGNIENLTDCSFSITVCADNQTGEYLLTNAAASFAGSFTVKTDTGTNLGTLSVGGSLSKDGYRLALSRDNSDRLALNIISVSPEPEPPVAGGLAGDLNADGRADIVMTITQAGHGAYGATGAWLIQSDQTAAWGDLSQRNAGWEIFGMGRTAAGKATADVYVRSPGNVIGAWTTGDDGRVSGWATVGEFDAQTQIVGLGDFDGNGQTDLLLRNTNGAVGCFFTNGSGWNYFQSLGDEWKLSAIGDLNGDGRDDVVLKHDAGFAGSWLTQADGTMAWADLDTLPDGFAIVGAGDFNGDGTDDVLLQKGSYFGAWLVQDGHAAGWMGLGDLPNVTVEQIADFDGDGKDDLRVRTTAGDLGSQLVKGADTLQWKYYGSVGDEWSTALAAL